MDREQWNALRYPIEIRELSEQEGGGFIATIPLLGAGALVADGESVEEAYRAIEELRRNLYDEIVGSGQTFALPEGIEQNVVS